MRINDETANVAADLLRLFFRQLSEPLIPPDRTMTMYHIGERALLHLKHSCKSNS